MSVKHLQLYVLLVPLGEQLIKIQLLAKTVTGEEIAQELISILGAQYGITTNEIVAIMRDCASVNNVAFRTLKIVYPIALDVGCISHTLNPVGDHFKLPNLLDFHKVFGFYFF